MGATPSFPPPCLHVAPAVPGADRWASLRPAAPCWSVGGSGAGAPQEKVGHPCSTWGSGLQSTCAFEAAGHRTGFFGDLGGSGCSKLAPQLGGSPERGGNDHGGPCMAVPGAARPRTWTVSLPSGTPWRGDAALSGACCHTVSVCRGVLWWERPLLPSRGPVCCPCGFACPATRP